MNGPALRQPGDPVPVVGAWRFDQRINYPTPGFAVVVLLLLGLGLAFGTAAWMQAQNARVISERLDASVVQVSSLISERMAKYEYGLRGARGAVIAAGENDITRESFRRYSLTRDIDREFPGARGFGFIRRVAAGDEPAFLAKARRDGAPDFALRQITPHPDERYVLQYLEPVEQNRQAVGLDIASEDHRRRAAIMAMETGQATLTAPITLVQTSGMRERGFIVFLPATRVDMPGGTPDERRAQTFGWTVASLVIDEVLAGLDLDPRNFTVTIADGGSDAGIRFYGADVVGDPGDPSLVRRRSIPVFGRTWDVEIRALPPFVSNQNLTVPAVAGGGVMTGMLLLSGIVYLVLFGRRRAIVAAVERSRLAAIVENAGDAIIGKTLDGVVTDWNPAAERLFGFHASEAIGRRAQDLIVPAHLGAEERDTLDRVRRDEPVGPLSTLRLRRDGSIVPVEITVSPMRSAQGQAAGVAMIVRDITQQLAAEDENRSLNASLERQVAERTAQLRTAAAWQDAILRYAGYAVIATDLDGVITLFNPAAERMLGYSANEVVGVQTPGLFHDPREVADRAAVLSLELSEQVMPGFGVFVAKTRRGLSDTAEWTYVTKGGRRHPVLLNVSLLRTADGRDLGFLGIAMDLSERRRHEAEMKAAQAGTWRYVAATGRVRMSAECARQHGLPDVETEIDVEHEWRHLAHPEDIEHVLTDLGSALETGGSYTTEFRIPLPGGGLRWINAMGRVETDAEGRATDVLGLTLDITARKQAEIALSEAKIQADAARAEAERANAAKTDFLASMSHEIRTPLNSILGFASLVMDDLTLSPMTRRHTEIIHTSGQSLLMVVNDILDFSKVEAGAIELEERAFSLANLSETSLAIVEGTAAKKLIDVRASIDQEVPAVLIGDEGRLRQILLNLLNNAVKFTPNGYVTLIIRHEGFTSEGERIRFSVVDTGIGIPREKQDRLFQKFSQADSSVNREFGGTGLGLAISKSLIELMGGEIGVFSELGRGSTFWFTLTLPIGTLDEAPLVPITQPAPKVRGTLLLVEDVQMNQELGRIILEAAGHTVDIVSDGSAAVQAAQSKHYDLILMDVQMPGMDGLTATKLIRKQNKSNKYLPIIAMTANVFTDQINHFRDAGMNDHIGKPFNRADLYAKIERWLVLRQ